MPKTIEPQPCSICGGSHPPGACPKEAVKTIPVDELTPEEKKEGGAKQAEVEFELSKGQIDNAEKLIALAKEKNIPLDFDKPEIAQSFQKGLEECLSQGQIVNAEKLIALAKEKNIPLDFDKPEITQSFQRSLHGSSIVIRPLIAWAEEKNIALDFSKPEIAQSFQKGLKECLSIGWIDNAEKLIALAKEKNIPLDFSTPEIAQSSQEGLEHCLSYGRIDEAEKLIAWAENKKIPLEIAQSSQKELEHCLSYGRIDEAEKFIAWAENKKIPLEIAQACQKELESHLLLNRIDEAEKLIALAERKKILPEIAQPFQEKLESHLLLNRIDEAEKLIAWAKEKNIPLDFDKPEIAQSSQKGLEHCLSYGLIDNAEKFIAWAKEKNIPLDFSTPEIAQSSQKELERRLSQGQIDNAEKLIAWAKEKNIALEIVQACQKGLEHCLSQGQIYDAEKLIAWAKEKNLSLDFAKPEIAQSCQKGLEACLLKENIDDALEINRRFLRLAPEKAFEFFSAHLPLQEFEKYVPNLVLQAQKSLEIFFNLFQYREKPETLIKVAEENPFLIKALEANPRFGPKLILKYPTFDQVSQAKIQFLFETKQALLQDRPDLAPESLEFRRAMQERMLSFDRNAEIIAALKEAGVDDKSWLQYEDTEYFTLRSGQELVPFSERARTPLDRLAQTIGTYAYQIKSVLSEWRKDLLELEIEPGQAEEDKARLDQMQAELEKAKQKGNEPKASGIRRGLEGLGQKMERVKKISLWARLMGEIESFTKLKEILTKSQEELILKEKKYAEFASSKSPSGVEMNQLKSQIAQAKEDFRKRLGQLERRLEAFRANFSVLISGLGKDRANSLEQELNEKMAEQFSHYDADRSTLEALFSERADKEKEKLEDRPMSIFVWARNPDIDLYQGNYSPCCICIESAHMGAESTIADYATDLGIQIVNIWDEQKQEPVASAWCWIGEDEQGKTALVVDNIEANTAYSSNFSAELWSRLKAYLENYAQAIKADCLILGKNNNDLPTASELAKLPEAEAKYEKLGGENSRPNGYFLEAEENPVKLLWEKSKKEIVKAKESKEKRPKIELKDLLSKELTTQDFAKIVELEKQVYEEGLVRGQEMIKELKAGKGLDYSIALYGKRPTQDYEDLLGYLIAYNDETDEGKPCVYLDDIAVAPDAQGQGLGWQMLLKAVERLKVQAKKQGKPILFDMHLRQDSQRLFERHKEDLERMGVRIIESALVSDYYDEGEDALYSVYEVRE